MCADTFEAKLAKLKLLHQKLQSYLENESLLPVAQKYVAPDIEDYKQRLAAYADYLIFMEGNPAQSVGEVDYRTEEFEQFIFDLTFPKGDVPNLVQQVRQSFIDIKLSGGSVDTIDLEIAQFDRVEALNFRPSYLNLMLQLNQKRLLDDSECDTLIRDGHGEIVEF